jgi:hypothetical protein
MTGGFKPKWEMLAESASLRIRLSSGKQKTGSYTKSS